MSARVAIVGGGLGGLTAAARLAHAGCDVSLFEAASSLGGKCTRFQGDGLTLDLGPTLLTLPHVVRETFAQVGASDLMPSLTALSEQCRYEYVDGSRFSAFADVDRTAASAGALGPSESAGLYAFYEEAGRLFESAGEPYLEAPFQGMAGFLGRVAKRGMGAIVRGLKMGTLDQMGRRHFRTDQLRQFVGRFATYVGASPYLASAAFALIPHLERAWGVHHVRGGMGALSDAFEVALRRLAVRIHLGTPVRWRREGAKFRIDDVDTVFDALISNRDPLADTQGPRSLALSGYVLLLEADRRVSLPHHSVFFSENPEREFSALFAGTPVDRPTLYACHPAASDETVAPPGKSGIFVMANAPALTGPLADNLSLAEEHWATQATALRARCIEVLSTRFPPGTRLRVLAERTPVSWARQGAPGGSLYGFLPHGRFGPFERPRMRGTAPGMFFAGGGTHPGGGVPMVMLSGTFAARMALEHLGMVS